jgi:uncharacterized membrane protein YphA (DoxX/SURF4 family)
MANRAPNAVEPYLRSLMRIVLGFTFSSHGLQKLFGFFGGFGGHGGTVHRTPCSGSLVVSKPSAVC